MIIARRWVLLFLVAGAIVQLINIIDFDYYRMQKYFKISKCSQIILKFKIPKLQKLNVRILDLEIRNSKIVKQ